MNIFSPPKNVVFHQKKYKKCINDIYRVSDQCIVDTYRIIQTITIHILIFLYKIIISLRLAPRIRMKAILGGRYYCKGKRVGDSVKIRKYKVKNSQKDVSHIMYAYISGYTLYIIFGSMIIILL